MTNSNNDDLMGGSGETGAPGHNDVVDDRSQQPARPSMLWRAAHVFALAGFAIAQPLFGLLGAESDFWVARQATTVDVVVFILAVVVVVPAFLFGIEWVADKVNDSAGWFVHLVIVAALAGLVFVGLVDGLTNGKSGSVLVLGLAGAGAVLFALAYRSVKFVRDFVGILVIAPLLFAGLLVIRLPPLGGYDVPVVNAGITEDNPVVVVVFDEFQLAGIQNPDGTIDATRYPGVASLADSATFYPYATTVNDDSLLAVPAILSGQVPEPGLTAVASDYPVNLFTVLGSTHTLIADEDITRLCPPSLCVQKISEPSSLERLQTLFSDTAVVYLHTVTPGAWRDSLPDIGARWGNFLAGDDEVTVEAAQGSSTAQLSEMTAGEGRAISYGQFLDSFDPGLGAALYYLHVDLPHIPWTFLPSGDRYPEIGLAGKDEYGFWRDDPWLVQQGYVRTALHAGFTDTLIAQTVAKLKDLGMWDDALVVFVADHGQHYAVNEPRRSFTDSNLPGIAGVPLFIKFPGQSSGIVDDSNVQTIDVLPTIVASLGGTLDDIDGVELQGSDRPETKTMVSKDGMAYSPDLETYIGMDAAYRQRMLDLAPSGIGYEAIFEVVGPRPDLFGTDTDSLPTRAVAGRWELADGDQYLNFDPTAAWDPVGVLLTVDTESPNVEYYAVAVNGTILATITPYRTSDTSVSILAIVPPGSFSAGHNDVQVFGIEGPPGATTLISFESGTG